MEYKTKEVIERTGLSRQMLYRLRKGQTAKRKAKGGGVKIYEYPPELEKYEDYYFLDNDLIYTESGLNKIIKRS